LDTISIDLGDQDDSATISSINDPIANLNGGSGSDTLNGANTANTWSLGATQTYTGAGAGVTFSNFQTLQGGSNTDQFNVTVASALNLKAGGGQDTFNIGEGLTGAIDGEAGTDILQGTQIDAAVLTGSDGDGFAGTEASINGGFDGIATLTGNGGMVTGQDVASTWALDGAPTYSNVMHTLNISGFATLQGGTNADQFNVTAGSAFNLNGGAGQDTFDIDAALTGAVDGEAGTDILQGNQIDAAVLTGSDGDGFAGTEASINGGFDGIATLTGNGGTLTGQDVASVWALDGAPTYSNGTHTLNVSGFATLQGGTNADQFNVTAGSAFNLNGGAGQDAFDIDAALTGAVDGEAGTDILQGDVIDAVVLSGSDGDGFAGTEASISGGFDGIATLTGNGGTVTGQDVASTWALDGAPTYWNGTHTLNISGFATLQGGSNTDQFNVTAASAFNLNGGAGQDTFDIDAALTGAVDGEAGTDILQGDVIDAAVLTGSDGDGFSGTEASISGGFDGIATLTANGGTLTGQGVGSTWNWNAVRTYNNGSHTLNFSGFATLQGGGGSDVFHVTPSAGTSITVNGGAPGAAPGDILNFTTPMGETTEVFTDRIVATNHQSVYYSNVETINISSDITVNGTGNDDILDVTASGASSGSYVLTAGGVPGPTINMTGVTRLTFNGLAGSDKLALDQTSLTNQVFGPVNGIIYNGGESASDNDVLEIEGGGGAAFNQTYTVGESPTEANEGTLSTTNGTGNTQTITFTGLEPISDNATAASLTINASSSIDTINVINGPVFQGDQTLEVNFNGAFEKIQLANKTTLDVNAAGGGDTINVNYSIASTGLGTLTINGNASGDTINLLTTTPSGVTTNLRGGGGADSFDFTAGVLLRGEVDGQSGEDTLDLSAYATARSVSLSGIGGSDGYNGTEAALTGSFSNIDQILAPSAGGDTLSGANLHTTWTLASNNNGTLSDGIAAITSPTSGHVVMPARSGSGQNLAFTSFENLTGGTGNDWFDLANGVGVSGQIDGGTGNNTLDYRDYTSAINVDLSAGTATSITGNLATGGTGSSIENVFGGSAADTITGDADDNVLGDGLGSDTLSGGLGNDRYVLTPGGDDVLNETPAGSGVHLDTLDFSLASAGVTIDMDLLAVPQDVFGGNTVQLNREAPAPAPSGFENFIGSDYADTVDIDPLAVIRSVEGNDPATGTGDTLNFDAGGSIVIDNSTSLTASGIGTVLYSEIETIDLFDVAPRIIDNGDVGWSFTGGWGVSTAEGYEDDFRYIASGTASDVANWTFDGVTPGLYLVSATWPSRGDRASDATYTVKDDTTPVGSAVSVDQQSDPGDLRDDGALWEDLGLYAVASHTLRVDLSGLGTGIVAADAIRIERINQGLPEIRVLEQDTLDNIPDGTGVSDFGSTLVGTSVTKTYVVHNLGTANLSLGAVSFPTGYTVGSFSQNPVPADDSATLTVTLDAVAAGTYSGELSFSTNDRNENPFNFSITGSVIDAPATSQIVDNDDVGFTVVLGTWDFNGTSSAYYLSDHRYHAPGIGSSVVQWEFTVMPGSVYRVSGTWAGTWNRASDAPFTIGDGVSSVTVDIDQGTLPPDHPNSFQDQGADWADLVPAFVVDGGSTTLTVQLSDDASGYVIADAVRIEELVDPEISVFEGADELASASSEVDFGTTQVGAPVTKTFTVKNVGAGTLALVEPITLPLGFSLVSSFGDLTLDTNETTTFQVQLDAAAPGEVNGAISFANGDDDENPFVFDVTAVITGLIVDDGDTGFQVVSGTWGYVPSYAGYFQEDHHYHAPGSGTNVAEWQFTNLVPGATYEVSANWFGTWNRASDAPYTISDGVSSVTVDMDQGTPPDDLSDAGASWERVTTFTLDASRDALTVRLSDDANGYVIADGVRLEQTYLPEIEVTLGGALITDGQSQVDYGQALVNGPLTKTFTVTNTGGLPLILNEPISVTGSGFSASGFGDAILDTDESTTFTVTLTSATAGTFNASLWFSSNDVDENPFEFTTTGEVLDQLIVDDGDAGFSVVSGTWGSGGGADYFQGDHRYHAPGSGGSVVQW